MSAQEDGRQDGSMPGERKGVYSMVCAVPDMDLGQIASSGQCFRMEEREPGLYSIIAGDRYAEIEEIEEAAGEAGMADVAKETGTARTAEMTGAARENGTVGMADAAEIAGTAERTGPDRVERAVRMTEEKGADGRTFRITFSLGQRSSGQEADFWRHYFDLETDYGEIKAQIPKEDPYLTQAARMGWGIRILRQDLWETIVTFIISQQNNIPRIRRCVRSLCERYGREQVNFRGEIYHAFPGPKELAGAKLEELKACNLGYRARYILESARMAAEGRFSLEKLQSMGYEEAKDTLLKLCGVGVKVAECVCLFALHHIDAFPVDTHIAQALAAHYPEGFPFERYTYAGGVLQQYIFFYEVNKRQAAI